MPYDQTCISHLLPTLFQQVIVKARKMKKAAGLTYAIQKIFENALPFEHAKPSLKVDEVKAESKADREVDLTSKHETSTDTKHGFRSAIGSNEPFVSISQYIFICEWPQVVTL